MPLKLFIYKEKVLTILDVPEEDDAFLYMPLYDGWIEEIFNKANEKKASLCH